MLKHILSIFKKKPEILLEEADDSIKSEEDMSEIQIPCDIVLSKLHNYRPSWFGENIYWNKSQSKFALTYSIGEANMGHRIGKIAIGEVINNQNVIKYCLEEVNINCNNSPEVKWINDTCVVFQVFYSTTRFHEPFVVIDANAGFDVSNDKRIWENPEDVVTDYLQFTPFNQLRLLNAVILS